jgi:hypothetical protein
LSKCIGEEIHLEFSEKTKSLKTLENSARRALSWCKCAQKELLFEFREKEVSRRGTFTRLLNTLQAQQVVLEKEVSRGNFHPFKERKGQRP